MKFGVAVTTSVTPATTASAQAEYVQRLAPVIEESGYDSIWVSDRTVFPVDLATRYPEMYGPGLANAEAQNVLEALTTLSFVAGATSKLRLGISVLVLPFRNPVLNAKMITTLDVLSGGRVTLGAGVGWMPEEFEAMGASHSDRGPLTDEHIEMFKALCTQDVAEYSGRHFSTSGMIFFPKPLQKPHPPIWIGGNTRAAIRRTARLGDAWHSIRLTPDEIEAGKKSLHQLCDENQRNPDEVQVTMRATVQAGEPGYSPEGNRILLTGTFLQIKDDVLRYREAGLEYLVLSVSAKDTDATADVIRQFADEVVSRI